MKRALKIVAIIAASVTAIALLGLGAAFVIYPRARATSAHQVDRSPEHVARGRYLANHVTNCIECHSQRVMDRYGMPVKPGTEGAGGFNFSEGDVKIFAANITPDRETGIGTWTDDQIIRAIREGVDKDGQPLFPSMPYKLYAQMSDQDVRDIVAYIRTLQPIRNAVPPKHVPAPMNVIMRFLPRPIEQPVTAPDPQRDPVRYGQYLTTVAGCVFCHSPKDAQMANIAGREFSGGFEMRTVSSRVVTANITPHPATFVGQVTKDEFINHFRSMQTLNAATAPIAPKGRNTVMPWEPFSHMEARDLGAIYDYLHSLKPIENKVNSFPDAQ